MKKRATVKYLLGAGIAGLLTGVCVNANASAFQLYEYNGVNAGDFGAGAAATASDASTAYSNPAGMILIPNQQIVVAGNEIITDVKFKGSETWSNTNTQAPQPLVNSNFSPTETGTAQGGVSKFVPALHYVAPISNQWAFGFSILAPFGLSTNYGDTSVLRYSATDTELTTIDLSPTLAYKATDKLSVGAGLDIEHLDATFDAVVGAPPNGNAAGLPNSSFDTESNNEGSGWGAGWHAGLLYQFTPATRVGLTYHSQVRFALDGTSKLTGPLAQTIPTPNSSGVFNNNSLHTDITLPPSTELGAYHEFNQQWSMDGSIIYTQWSVFNDVLHVQNVQGITQGSSGAVSPQTVTISLPNDYRNTWRFALGANYRPTDKWILRAGGGFDESPVRDQFRGARLPDGDRFALALGAHYQAIKTLGFDVGWTHLFIKSEDVNINAASGSQVANTNGRFTSHADIVGAQVTWDIA